MFNRLETIFHYKQAAQPRYVLALDKSSPMDERVSDSKTCFFSFPFRLFTASRRVVPGLRGGLFLQKIIKLSL